MKLTGAQALVRILASEQVAFAFGVVGGKLAPLLHAIHQQQSIRYVGARHEAAAAMMAAGAFARSGRIAAALAEMGPGTLNLAAGTGVAFNNNLAALLITTNQHRMASYPHAGMFMDLNAADLMKPITKWNATVNDARRIPELARRAFREALGGRPGPVHLDVPQDVLSSVAEFADDEFDIAPERYRMTTGPRAAVEAINAAADLLKKAQRPLIVAGGGVVASSAESAVRKLAALLKAPVIPTQMALGVVSTDDPHFIGHGGIIGGDAIHQAFAQSDVVIAIGCRFSSWMWDNTGPLVRRHHQVININIDPTALGAPAMHDVAVHADASLALADLLSAVGDGTDFAVDASWLPKMRQMRSEYDAKLAAMASEQSETMHPAALARAIATALPRDALVVYDGGHTTFWSNDFTPAYDVRTRFHDPGMSQLGFGLPYAIAIQLLNPGTPVILITGDGAFGFTLQELDSARRHRLPVVTIIHNNAAWGIIKAGQKSQLNFELGASLEGTDYAAIARGFGCLGETVTTAEEIGPAVQRALSADLPTVIDCRTRFVPHPCLPAFGRMNQFGSAH